MTVSIGNILTGSFASKSAIQANADNGDSTFQDVLGDKTGHAKAKHAAGHPHRSRDAALNRLMRDNEHPDARVAKDEVPEEADGNKTHHFLLAPGKAVRTDDDTSQKTIETGDQAASGASVHERLPLLMSLQEINRASTVNEKPDPSGDTDDKDGASTTLRRTAEPVVADIDPDSKDTKPAKMDTPRNVEAQQPAPRTALPATVAAEPGAEPAATVENGGGKPVAASGVTEKTTTTTSALPDEPVGQPPLHERVAVVSTQSFPAPVMPSLDPTTSRLVTAIAADIGSQPMSPSAALTPAMPHQAPAAAHILKIELHPAELGVVNAHLRLTGEQLSIELLPETHEAYQRLSSDGDSIARALRDLGFDVGKITVLQPSVAVAPPPRTDAANSPTALPNRDSSSFQSGQSGSNGNNSGEHHSGRGHDNDAQNPGRPASTARGRADSGLFI